LTRLRRAAAAELHGDNAAKQVTLSWLQGSLTGDEFEALNHWVTLLRAVLDLQQKQHHNHQQQQQQAPDAALLQQQPAGAAAEQAVGAQPAAATEESGQQQQLPQQPAGAQAAQQESGSIAGPVAATGGGMTDKELLAWLRQPGNEKHHLRVMLECLKEIGASDVPARVLLGHKVGVMTAALLLRVQGAQPMFAECML
jgi:hypothetical protein